MNDNTTEWGGTSQGSTSGASSSSGGSGGSGTSGGYSWLDDYQSGNYDSLPHDQIYSSYRDWSRDASPDDVYEGTYQGYQNLPQEQLRSAASDLHSYTQRGLDLSDLGLSSNDHQQWNAQDLARVTGRTYGHSGSWSQEQSEKKEDDKESGGVPKPIIGLALAGALAFAASRIMGGKSDKEDKKDKTSSMDYSMNTGVDTGMDTGMDTTRDYAGGASMGTSSDYGTSSTTSGYSTTGTSSGYGTSGISDSAWDTSSDQSGSTSDYSGDNMRADDQMSGGSSGRS